MTGAKALEATIASNVAASAGQAPRARRDCRAAASVRPTHPGMSDPFLPAPTPEQEPEVAAALAQPIAVVGSVLADMGVDPDDRSPAHEQALRASIHGYVDLELRGSSGRPNDVEPSFITTTGLVIDAIATHSATGRTRTPK